MRPQIRKINRKTKYRHKPNFRETHSGQKSGVQFLPISESIRIFQNLQMPFGGVDITQASLKITMEFPYMIRPIRWPINMLYKTN